MNQQQLSQLLMQQPSNTQNQLNQRAQLAQMLLQSGQQTSSPIVAALAGFLGTNELQNIADQQGKVDAAAQQRETAKELYKIDVQERQMAEQQRQFNEQMKQNAQQFAAKIGLEREKFNMEALRDAQNNAITKIQDPKTGIDLLFKGLNPLNDGLEKGLQWGVDKDGNRVAVPIPVAPNEKASMQKQMTLEVVDRLLNNKSGVKSIVGAVDRLTPNLLPSSRQAETDIEQLKALLTIENLSALKGAMSDKDLQFITNVSAGQFNLDTASEKGVRNALVKMREVLAKKEDATGGWQIKVIE